MAQAVVNNCVRLPLPVVGTVVVPEAKFGRVQLGDDGASVHDFLHLLLFLLNVVWQIVDVQVAGQLWYERLWTNMLRLQASDCALGLEFVRLLLARRRVRLSRRHHGGAHIALNHGRLEQDLVSLLHLEVSQPPGVKLLFLYDRVLRPEAAILEVLYRDAAIEIVAVVQAPLTPTLRRLAVLKLRIVAVGLCDKIVIKGSELVRFRLRLLMLGLKQALPHRRHGRLLLQLHKAMHVHILVFRKVWHPGHHFNFWCGCGNIPRIIKFLVSPRGFLILCLILIPYALMKGRVQAFIRFGQI